MENDYIAEQKDFHDEEKILANLYQKLGMSLPDANYKVCLI